MTLQTTVITQTGAGTFTVPANVSRLRRVLLVPGGGGGGGSYGGGGGAGEPKLLENIVVTPGQEISYNVGDGGSGGAPISTVGDLDGNGAAGEDTEFNGVSAIGGGYGQGGAQTSGGGGDGGSGGGGGGITSGSARPGGSALGSIGSDGGDGNPTTASDQRSGGGGGGATQPGEAGQDTRGGNGGDGIDYSSLFGTAVGDGGWFCGGGAGGKRSGGSAGASGGKGGGADEAHGAPGVDAAANTGGGGGSSSNGEPGGRGGSGVLIIQYEPSAPDAVANLAITTLDIQQITATWSASAIADDYIAEALDTSDSVVATETVTGTGATLTGLSPDTSYTLRVTPRNEEGDGDPAELAFTTAPDGAPTIAPDLTVDEALNKALTISWPLVPGADEYVARLLTPTAVELETATVTAREVTFTGLTPNRTYRIEVRASNSDGGGPAGTVDAATYWRPPGDQVTLRLETVPLPAEGEATIDPDKGLKGVVRDIQNNPLANREVRVYRRADGEREATVTTDGNGEWVWSGANTALEYYVIAINPASDAEDYAPAAANRLVPVVVV